MATCFVICAGDFSLIDIPIKEDDYCIAVDGGYLYCKMLKIEPDLLVGDMDSLDETLREEVERRKERDAHSVVELSRRKDDTDTLAALRIALDKGYKQFCLYGAMGGRLEHTIANIQCLTYLKNCGAKGYIMDANVMMTVIKDETVTFHKNMEGYMSLFALGEKAEGVTITGMKYLLDGGVITNDYPIGISNEFMGEEGKITVEKGQLLIIIAWP